LRALWLFILRCPAVRCSHAGAAASLPAVWHSGGIADGVQGHRDAAPALSSAMSNKRPTRNVRENVLGAAAAACCGAGFVGSVADGGPFSAAAAPSFCHVPTSE
jgi:hypothetical protein